MYPHIMPDYHGAMVPCPGGCGTDVPKRVRKGRQKRCIDCAVTLALEAARQMREKTGEAYERWVAAPHIPGPGRGKRGVVGASKHGQ